MSNEPRTSDGRCALCRTGRPQRYKTVDGVAYTRCDTCGTLVAETSFLERTERGEARVYDADYWSAELSSARERSFGSSIIRVGEVFHYARRPIRRFLDVSCGSGALLDAVSQLLPDIADRFWGVEPFPPPPEFRSRHPNYVISFLDSIDMSFDAGVCIEVIEHLTPAILRNLVKQIARISAPNAIWYFNSAQPSFVEEADPAYLDPFGRGHVASYSLDGLRPVFAANGMVIHPLPGRNWAFLAEKSSDPPLDRDHLYRRVWNMLPENRAALAGNPFGPLVISAGLEGARCYLEADRSESAMTALLGPRGTLRRRLFRKLV